MHIERKGDNSPLSPILDDYKKQGEVLLHLHTFPLRMRRREKEEEEEETDIQFNRRTRI